MSKEALEASITKYRSMIAGAVPLTLGSSSCPLCKEYNALII
jgi:hypothetical protein